MANPLHERFDWAFFHLCPDAPPEAIVYEVDFGEPDDANVTIKAAVFEGDMEPTGRMLSEPIVKMVAKSYLRDLAEGKV